MQGDTQIGHQQTPRATSAAGRLGEVLSWVGTLFGLLLVGLIYAQGGIEPLLTGPGLIIAGVCFFVPYLIGRALRYVLAGR